MTKAKEIADEVPKAKQSGDADPKGKESGDADPKPPKPKAVRSPPKNKQSPSPAKKARRKISSDEGECVENDPALEPSEVAYGEFQDAIDLSGISVETQEKMFAVAPVLRGRHAVYSKEFFCNVVGLCGEGVSLTKVHIDEAEILMKWLVKNSCYELADCLDSNEAAKFSDHWSKVYGENPDNSYFSMRFLRGCYATFVHEISVNWAEEALTRRRQREENRAKNPKKLGPIALRQQIVALCKLVTSMEADPDLGSKNLAAAKAVLQQFKADEVKANDLKRKLIKKLHDAKEALEGCYAAEDDDDLSVRHSKTSAEAKLLRIKGDLKGASAKRAEANALLTTMNERSEKTRTFEGEVADIESELLPKVVAKLKRATDSMAKAEQRVKDLTICPVCKDAMDAMDAMAEVEDLPDV